MKKRKAIFAALLAATLLSPSAAFAVKAGPKHVARTVGTLLNDVALNGLAATRTFTIGPFIDANNIDDLAGWDGIAFYFDFTHSNDGKIKLTCTGGYDASNVDGQLGVCVITSGTCVLTPAGVIENSANLTGDTKFWARLGTMGFPVVKCVAEHTGTPDANDKLTVLGWTYVD